MNWLDIVLLIPCLLGLIKGVNNGFIREIFQILSLIVGVWLATSFSNKILNFLLTKFPQLENNMGDYGPGVIRIIIFILIIVLVILILRWIGKMLEKVMEMVALSGINRILGALFGMMKGGLIALIGFYILYIIGVTDVMINEQTRNESALLEYVEYVIDVVEDTFTSRHRGNGGVKNT